MFWSSQTILWFYWKAAPKYEGNKGNTGSNEENEILNRLKQIKQFFKSLKDHLDIFNLPALLRVTNC